MPIIEGTIQTITTGKVVDTNYNGKPGQCRSFFIKINDVVLSTFTNIQNEAAFKVGDNVKLTYETKVNDYNGMDENKFKFSDYENLTSPATTPKNFGGNKGTWKPDPEKDLRISYMSCLGHAVECINSGDYNHEPFTSLQEKAKTIAQLAEYFVKKIYSFKLAPVIESPVISAVPIEQPVQNPEKRFNDDEIPF